MPDGDGQNSVGLPTQPQAFHGVENELESRLKTHRVSRWRKVEDCFVLFPPGDEPAAIVHFVGGAFVGAAPQLTYSAFLEELAAKGAVVCVLCERHVVAFGEVLIVDPFIKAASSLINKLPRCHLNTDAR